MITVSVVVTVYNVEKYIARCIDSILSQSYQEFELIIVNDGTPDQSMIIAEKYRQNDKRVRIIDYGNNVGLMCARRRGYLEAKGDYVFFVDSDDTIPDNALELLVDKARTSDADIVAGQGLHFLSDGTTKLITRVLPYGNDSYGLYKALTHFAFPPYVWGILYKTDLLKAYEYVYFEKLTNAEDYALNYQVAERIKSIECIQDVVYNYFQHKESSSQVRLSSWQIECNVMVYLFILHMLSRKEILREDIYASTQRAIARFCAKGYNADGLIWGMLDKYGEKDLLSKEKIFKYNSIKNAIICFVGVSKIGTFLYKYIHL